MPSLENANLCVEAVTILNTVYSSARDLATAMLISAWVINDQPIDLEESVTALARLIILDEEIATLKAKLSA